MPKTISLPHERLPCEQYSAIIVNREEPWLGEDLEKVWQWGVSLGGVFPLSSSSGRAVRTTVVVESFERLAKCVADDMRRMKSNARWAASIGHRVRPF